MHYGYSTPWQSFRHLMRPGWLRTYLIISSVFLVISFWPDILAVSAPMPGAGWPYSITLMIMHVIAGLITVVMLVKLTE